MNSLKLQIEDRDGRLGPETQHTGEVSAKPSLDYFIAKPDHRLAKQTPGSSFDRLEEKIDKLTEYINRRDASVREPLSMPSGSDLLQVSPLHSCPTKWQKFRIVSICASSLIAAALSVSSVALSAIDLYHRLFLVALSLPAYGISLACILALFKGGQYDYKED